MTKVKFNYSELQRTVIPSLIDTNSYLDKTINTSLSLNIPGSFRYAETLRDLPNFLSNIKKELVKTKDWLITSNRQYEEAVTNIESMVNSIDTIVINKRNKIVNNVKSSN
ncbi:MAG: hypothetical protein ACM3O4_05935 [Ignavibacteriales bacterium]